LLSLVLFATVLQLAGCFYNGCCWEQWTITTGLSCRRFSHSLCIPRSSVLYVPSITGCKQSARKFIMRAIFRRATC